MAKPLKKQSLGRGLDVIFGNSPELAINSIEDKNADKIVGNIIELELDLIEVNPFQPRTSFNEEELQGLASSIEELGVVQPITVRKLEGKNKYLPSLSPRMLETEALVVSTAQRFLKRSRSLLMRWQMAPPVA